MNSLAILLTVHNRKEKTLSCLEIVGAQRNIENWEIDIFLTDDGCTDGTSEAIKKKFPYINIIKGDGSLYWNRGMILAWTAAANTKDYSAYLWLNDDTFLLDNSLINILKSHYAAPEAIIVGSCKASDSEIITYGGGKDFSTSQIRIIPNGKLQECGIFNGNIILVPKYVYKILGTMDPVYHHALGDSDYALCAKEKGIDIYVCEEVLGICDYNFKVCKWNNKEYSLIERLKNLHSPTGYTRPKEYFHFKRKHWGFLNAIGSIIKMYKNLVFPT